MTKRRASLGWKFRRALAVGTTFFCLAHYFYQRTVEVPIGPFLYLYFGPVIVWAFVLIPVALLNLRSKNSWSRLLPLGTLTLTLLVFAEPSLRGSSPGSADLRVVSANVQSWSVDPLLTTAELLRTNPDLILFQELWDPLQLVKIQEAMPDYLVWGDSTYFAGTAIASRWPLESCQLPPPDHCAAAILQIGGERILLLTLQGQKESHLSPQGLTGTLKLQRKQLAEIRQFIESIGLPVIAAGDFNAPGHAPLTQFFTSRFKDSFKEAGLGYGLTFPAALPILRLDRVLYSGELGRAIECRSLHVGTDHRAVITDLELAGTYRAALQQRILGVE